MLRPGGIVALRSQGVNRTFRTFSGLETKLTDMRILVVDDEPAVRRSVRSALTLEGYEVRLASEGAEALDVLASEHVDAVVLDLLMPGVDGLEVCRRLPRAAIPLLC